MSALWYEYLEESGGEVIPSKFFYHVNRSFETTETLPVEFESNEIKHAFNYSEDMWWPIKVIETLSEGWINIEYFGTSDISDNIWYNIRNNDNRIQLIKCCIQQKVKWKAPMSIVEGNISDIIKNGNYETNPKENIVKQRIFAYERIKIGCYLECWLEKTVGIVWPVKVLSNIGGRVRLAWFGSEGKQITSTIFTLFYLNPRLRGLGWARLNGWRYCAPENAGITIAISNPDTFVRGSPGALPREMCCQFEPGEHMLEEGWQLEAVDPSNPEIIRPAVISKVFNRQYFLVRLEDDSEGANIDTETMLFAGFSGMATLMPANFGGVSGYDVRGLAEHSWHSHLMSKHTDRYAPHSAYFPPATDSPVTDNCGDLESAFLPGCKLEAVNPRNTESVHAATVTRCMDGNRLIWVRLDSEPRSPDFLVDPRLSVDLYPVGWCEMVGHPLVMPTLDPPPTLSSPVDLDEITVFLYPQQCYLGPFLSRSAAVQILPRFIGPGHCLPVFRELFHLLLKVSHKPHKLKRLLQLDNSDDRHDLMATIAIPSPKSEYSSRNRGSDWLVEVAVRKRAVPEFCRQTALSLGACPWFITTSASHYCSLGCEARLCAKAGEKMSQQRRRHLFARPLIAAGISYRSLKSRIVGTVVNSSSNSEAESTEEETTTVNPNVASEHKVQTRGLRLPVVYEQKRRCSRRKPFSTAEKAAQPRVVELSPAPLPDDGSATGAAAESPADDLGEYAIDPAFLAGDIARVTLSSNPLGWSAEEVADYLAGTDCRQLASWLASEHVDGPAFLLLTLPVLSTLCGMQLEAAVRLCRHVVSIKRAFVEQFLDYKSLLPPDL